MEFSDYIRIIRQRGWLIILLAILTAGAAFGFSKMQTPVYKASARLLITTRFDFGQTQAARELRRDFAAYLRSSYRAEEVIKELQLDTTPQQLLSNVTIAPSTSESVVQVDYESTDPDVAKRIAELWAQQLIHRLDERNRNIREEDRIRAELLDNPTVGLDRPKTKINTAAGAVFGSLLGLVIIFLLEWFESGTVHRAEDVTRFLDIPVIGSIPQQ